MAICMVCKGNRDIGGATYQVDGNVLNLCKDCYGKVETRILVVCVDCGFYWVLVMSCLKKPKKESQSSE